MFRSSQPPDNALTSNTKKIIAVAAIAVTIISALVLAGFLMSNFPDDSTTDENKEKSLTVALYQTVSYSNQGIDYEFKYLPTGQVNLLVVSSKGETQTFGAFTGAAYNVGDLKITILFADEKLINLKLIPQ